MTEKISITDGTTGETIVRDMTPEELENLETTRAELAAEKAIEEQTKAEAAAKKAAAEAKLAALGLTADDLKALGLGGN